MLPLLARPVRKQVWQISTLNCFRLRYLQRAGGQREKPESAELLHLGVQGAQQGTERFVWLSHRTDPTVLVAEVPASPT